MSALGMKSFKGRRSARTFVIQAHQPQPFKMPTSGCCTIVGSTRSRGNEPAPRCRRPRDMESSFHRRPSYKALRRQTRLPMAGRIGTARRRSRSQGRREPGFSTLLVVFRKCLRRTIAPRDSRTAQRSSCSTHTSRRAADAQLQIRPYPKHIADCGLYDDGNPGR